MMAPFLVQTYLYMSMAILYSAEGVMGLQWPTNFADIAKYSDITATKTCTIGTPDTPCNTTCPTRTAFPSHRTPPLSTALSTDCKTTVEDTSIPEAVNKMNGVIIFNSSSFECNSVNTTTYNGLQFFTISMWINVNCDYCDILISGTSLELKMISGRLNFNGYGHTIAKNEWHHIAIRYESRLKWYVDNQIRVRTTITQPPPLQISLGPNKNMTNSEFIKMADVRLYEDALTEREINSLHTGQFDPLPMDSNCRCPRQYPVLVKNTFPRTYMKCTDFDGSKDVSRFNQDAKYSAFLNDNDTTTSWHSGTVGSDQPVNIMISLPKTFQIHELRLEGVTREPEELKIVIYKDNTKMNEITFSQSCQSGSACNRYKDHQSTLDSGGHTFSYVLDSFLIQTDEVSREKYETVVADKINLVIKTQDFFTSNEIRILARCNCYGNDGTCTISDGTYSCNCLADSNTGGNNCQNCSGSYYRLQPHLKCNIPCTCDTTGSSSTTCNELSGQCNCKNHVIGRTCNACEYNYANLSNSGCAACPCNSDGITECTDGPVCHCKNNVETSSNKCMDCLPDFYNITQSAGCLPCGCSSVGTDMTNTVCDKTTGQCPCKELVEGRKCDKCKAQSYDLSNSHALTGCTNCACNFVGSRDLNCDQVTGNCTCKMKREAGISQRNCEPTSLRLDPIYGPITGSTILTVSGHDLGEDEKMSFNIDGHPQTVIDTKRNNTHIFIETKPSSAEGVKEIKLYWVDINNKEYTPVEFNKNFTFEYRKNPIIAAASKTPRKCYASGGCTLRFNGNNLNSVAYSKLLVQDTSVTLETPCTGESNMLTCLTPNMTLFGPTTNVTYGFYLDGIKMYQNVARLEIIEDPTIETGKEEDYKNSFDDVFKITGSNLNQACHDEDVAILFDGKGCKLLTRTDDAITCDPNESFPGKSRTVEVKVKIGNWEMVWGRLNIKSFWELNEFVYIVVGFCALLALVIAVVCFVCVRRRRRHNRQHTDFHELDEHNDNRISNPYERNPVAVVNPLGGQPTDTIPAVIKKRTSADIVGDFCKRLESKNSKVVKGSLVDRSHIEVGKICTKKGNIIRVVNGTYNLSSSSPNSGSSLTIKTLVDSYPEEGLLPDWLNTGLAECTRLQDFTHENVLRMMGITVDARNVYILYPEMSNRTLKDYVSIAKEPLTDDLKMNMCLQIAMGMNYLSAEGITHKDLAARNCWVTGDEVIKVGDASFAHDLYPKEYLKNGSKYQPIRWMAPECLSQGFYDSKSDVWSFGVVVWEIYTNGYLPFHDIENNSVVKDKVIREHYRLGKPQHCSDQLFGVIEQCHVDIVDNRPNFFLVVNLIESVINPEPSSPVEYVNENDLSQDVIYSNLTDPPPIPPKGRRK